MRRIAVAAILAQRRVLTKSTPMVDIIVGSYTLSCNHRKTDTSDANYLSNNREGPRTGSGTGSRKGTTQ
jgi:hypothetical protein